MEHTSIAPYKSDDISLCQSVCSPVVGYSCSIALVGPVQAHRFERIEYRFGVAIIVLSLC